MLRKLSSFFRYSGFVKVWFPLVYMGLGIAKLAIYTVTFRRLAPRLGVSLGLAPWVPLINEPQRHRARLIAQVIQLAARYTPWESNCFPQAVVARVMLGLYRVPYSLFFGVHRNAATGAFDAHAWVASGRVQITGGWGFHRYAVVGVFVSPCLFDGGVRRLLNPAKIV